MKNTTRSILAATTMFAMSSACGSHGCACQPGEVAVTDAPTDDAAGNDVTPVTPRRHVEWPPDAGLQYVEPATDDALDVTVAVVDAQSHMEKQEWVEAIRGWDKARKLCDRGPARPCKSSAAIYAGRAEAKCERIPALALGSWNDPRVQNAVDDAERAYRDATDEKLRFDIDMTLARIAMKANPTPSTPSVEERYYVRAWCSARRLAATGQEGASLVGLPRERISYDPCDSYFVDAASTSLPTALVPWQRASSWTELAQKLVTTKKLVLASAATAVNESDVRALLGAKGGAPWVLKEGDVLEGDIEDGNAILVVESSEPQHLLYREEHVAPTRRELLDGCSSLKVHVPKIELVQTEGGAVLDVVRDTSDYGARENGLGCARAAGATIEFSDPATGRSWGGVAFQCGDEPIKLTRSHESAAKEGLTMAVGSCVHASYIDTK